MKYSLSRFSVIPGKVNAARKALAKLVTAIQKDDPKLVYLLFQEPSRPVFFALASFHDEDAYRRHATSSHTAAFARSILPLCDGKPSFVGLDLLAATKPIKAPPSATPSRAAPSRSRRTGRPSVSLRAGEPQRSA